MSEDIFNALCGIEEQMARIAVALERLADIQAASPVLCVECGKHPHDGSGLCPECAALHKATANKGATDDISF